MTKTTISCKGVSKRYKRTVQPALAKIDLTVQPGEILALVGESGSGKTTLLRLVAGLETPDQGEIRINEKVVVSKNIWIPPEQRAIGVVFQEGALFPHRSVAGNIGYGLSKGSRESKDTIVAEMLSLVGLTGYDKRFPHELSGGECQRVALARALAPKPDVILLDEPFSSLDATLRRSLRDEICDILKELKITAILVVHDPEDALSAGDRIAILRKGQLEQVATPSKVYHQPANEYCANLFGPANLVSSKNQEPVWARPEEFQLLESAHEDAFAAKVLRIKDAGKYREIIVQLASTPEVEWLIRDTSGIEIKPNDQVWVQWNPLFFHNENVRPVILSG